MNGCKMAKIGVIIISYNSLTSCVELGCELLKYGFYPLIVDNSENAVTTEIMGVYVFASGQNLGYAKGFNYGCEKLLHLFPEIDIICISNSDIIVDCEKLQSAIQNWQLTSQNEIFGLAQVNQLEQNIQAVEFDVITLRIGYSEYLKSNTRNQIFAPVGSFLGGTVKTWQALNYLSPEYFLYFEELDLAMKAEKRKISLHILDNISIRHTFGETMTSSTFSLQCEFHSREIFCRSWVAKYRVKLFIFYILFALKNFATGHPTRSLIALRRISNWSEK